MEGGGLTRVKDGRREHGEEGREKKKGRRRKVDELPGTLTQTLGRPLTAVDIVLVLGEGEQQRSNEQGTQSR